METLSVYFFIAITLSIAFYIYLKKKKTTHPTADEVRVFNPKAPSKPKTKKESATGSNQNEGKTNSLKEENLSKSDKTGQLPELLDSAPSIRDSKGLESSKTTNPTVTAPQDDLENKIKQLQARTGWDYNTAKAYCLQSTAYHQKIAVPARLKKN